MCLLHHTPHISRSVATDQREQLVALETVLENIRDDSAKQVLAFREQADVLADETRCYEEAAVHLKGQLRKTQGLLSDAVCTIETLKDELQSDDYKRNSDYETNQSSFRQMEKVLSETKLNLKATEARYQIQQQESKRIVETKERVVQHLTHVKQELEVVRKQYDETRRNLLHVQRCAKNASVIEKNAARFLRDAKSSSSSSSSENGSASARGKLNGNGLPEIGSPRLTDTNSIVKASSSLANRMSGSSGSGSKRKSKGSKLGSRPGSAPLRRRDQNKKV